MSSSRETHLREEEEAQKAGLPVPQEPENCKEKPFLCDISQCYSRALAHVEFRQLFPIPQDN